MPFTIPNYGTATYTDQSEPDSVDFDILANAISANGIISGCLVTANNNNSPSVAAGTVRINGANVAVSAGTVSPAVAATTTDPRFDLVTITSAGSRTITSGTASSNPIFPVVPANSVALAAIYVPAGGSATITANNLVDKRVFIPNYVYNNTSYIMTRNTSLKPTDTSSTSTITLVSTSWDIPVAANTTYFMDVTFFVDSGAGGFKVGATVPSGATVVVSNGTGGHATGANGLGYTTATAAAGIIKTYFAVVVGATSGNMTITAAQNVSSTVVTTFKANSRIDYTLLT